MKEKMDSVFGLSSFGPAFGRNIVQLEYEKKRNIYNISISLR